MVKIVCLLLGIVVFLSIDSEKLSDRVAAAQEFGSTLAKSASGMVGEYQVVKKEEGIENGKE